MRSSNNHCNISLHTPYLQHDTKYTEQFTMKFVSKVYNNNINNNTNNKVTKVKRVLAPSAEKAKSKQRNIDF